MTNNKALEILSKSKWMCLSGNSDDFQKAVDHGFASILKNDQLNNDVKRLKAELEQSIKPCKVGDTVYSLITYSGDYERSSDRPYEHEVVFIGINGADDFFNTSNQKTKRMFSFKFSDIGKTIFLTKEDAVKVLESEVVEE